MDDRPAFISDDGGRVATRLDLDRHHDGGSEPHPGSGDHGASMKSMSDGRGRAAEVTGRVIDNPVSGERIVIRTSATETGGQLLVFDLALPPGGHVPARHAHPIQEERFTILEGPMRFSVAAETTLLNPAESVLLPKGHAPWVGK